MRARREYLALAGVLAAAAPLAAGCGGDDSAPAEPVQDVSGSQSQAALSKEDFIAQGDAICGEANVALASLDAAAAGDAEYQATQELEITRNEVESLQSLSPPQQGSSVLDRFLSALQDQVDALSRRQTAIEAGDDPAFADAEVSSAASSAQAAAQDYGFEDCANASEAPPAGGTTAVPPVATTTTPVPVTPTPPATGDPGAGGGTGVGGTGGGTGGGSGGGSGSGGGGTGGTGGTGGGVSP